MADPLSSISGISSGIDFKSLVDQIITLDRRPAVKMQATLDANAKRKDALEQFRTAVTTLKTASDALKAGTPFDAYSTTATGSDASGRNVLAAAAAPGASAGTYTVEVTRLATSQKTVASVGRTSSTTALGLDGTLVVGGQNVVIAPTDTLAGIRDKLNLASGTTNAQATLLSAKADGTDERLVLTGTKTGLAGAFAIADDPGNATSLVAALGLGAAPAPPAQDAALTVDGVSITRSTNSVSDAMTGVTLTLSALGTSTVKVERHQPTATAGIQSFVDGFNKLVGLVKQQANTTGAPLARDALLRGTRTSLAEAVLGTSSTSPADLATLASIGLSMAKDGTLSLDSTKFQDAYDKRPADLKTLMTDRMTALSTVADAVAAPITGQVDQRESAMVQQNDALQGHIDDIAARLDKKRTSLLAQYAKFEATIGRLKSVGDAMSAQFTGLNNSNNSN
jgi:flagellar hook-associated protein 2